MWTWIVRKVGLAAVPRLIAGNPLVALGVAAVAAVLIGGGAWAYGYRTGAENATARAEAAQVAEYREKLRQAANAQQRAEERVRALDKLLAERTRQREAIQRDMRAASERIKALELEDADRACMARGIPAAVLGELQPDQADRRSP